MKLRDALRMLRSETGLTQNEFASAMYVSFSTVNRWENQKMRPNRMQSKAILDFAKRSHVSAACLEPLTELLLAPRVDDKEDKERRKQADERIKLEQRDLLTAEQFRKTMDNIDMALIGQRFYNNDPASCDVFYYNNFFVKSFGYSQQELRDRLHRQPFFAIAPENLNEFVKRLSELLLHRIEAADFLITVKALRKDGTAFWLEVKAASLTEYSYGQEVFTFCRDVTRRVEAEQRYKEEVLLRDASMQVMFSNIHCDLTENRVSRHYNLAAVLGRDYGGETLDQLARLIADAAPDGKEKNSYLRMFNRDALLRAYKKGNVYGSVAMYNKNVGRWFRNEYLVVKNPVSGNIHALIYLFDIQRQVLSESILGIFLDKFFDFVGLIDVETETVEPYFYADGVFREQYHGRIHNYPSICEDKLRRYGYNDTSAQQSAAIDIRTVLAQLDKRDFYSTVLRLRGYDGKQLKKKITYTYLDGNRNTVIMAQSDLGGLERFVRQHKDAYARNGAGG